MKKFDLQNWEEFQQKAAQLRDRYPSRSSLLFRGLGDSMWKLTTTLERYGCAEMAFAEYYRLIAASKSEIETFTHTAWDIAEDLEIENLAREYYAFDWHLWLGKFRALGYMAYLRHQGFPSPLLDWTRSPDVAAFFAFRSPIEPPKKMVSVFAFCEMPKEIKTYSVDWPRIFHVGPNLQTHPRHYLQHGEYTICLRWEADKPWRFVPHEGVFSRKKSHQHVPWKHQDVLWKFNIPWSERMKALQLLDEQKINAFSLFDSEEAFLETTALRRFVFQRS